MESSLNRFKDKFIEEATELLDRLEKELLELENTTSGKELIESAFRTMHTIKGSSGMFGFEYICEFTHNLEDLYQKIRDNNLPFSNVIFDITFQSIDHIRKLLSDENLLHIDNQKNQKKLLDDINQINQSKDSPVIVEKKQDQPQKIKNTWHILLRTSEEIFFRGISLVNIFNELSTIGEFQISRIIDIVSDKFDLWNIFLYTHASESEIREVFLFIEDDCTIVKLTTGNIFSNSTIITKKDSGDVSILDFINSSGKKTGNHHNNGISQNNGNKRISVDSLKLDQLMFLVSELITVNSQLNLLTRTLEFDKIRPHLEKIDNLSKYFRNNALEIRLVPLSDAILRFKRLIRDLAKQLNKKIDLITEGIDIELDKGTLDQLNDPLMHIIRNCIDHGIELPLLRKNAGKKETGIIKISSYNSGNQIVIKIEDDGAGIDLKKIQKKAHEKGIIDKEIISEKEMLDIIFLPGFSTAQNITELSGRGVGMDVVKRKINELRGEIEVDTVLGKGTCFTLKIQQSLSIIDTLLFKVQDTFFIVPIYEINKCIEITSEEILKRNHTSTIKFEDELVPFYNIRKNLKLNGSYQRNIKVIILQKNGKKLALLTDSLIGSHQAVLKPLGYFFKNTKYISSASQLGDGRLAFMIDASELFFDVNII